MSDAQKEQVSLEDLNEREREIVALLREDSTLNKAKLAELLGCSDTTVQRTLQSMAQRNVIYRVGSNRKGEWIVNI